MESIEYNSMNKCSATTTNNQQSSTSTKWEPMANGNDWFFKANAIFINCTIGFGPSAGSSDCLNCIFLTFLMLF